MAIARGILGVAVLLLICYALSNNRKHINWRLIATGVGLQVVFALIMLKVPFVENRVEDIASFFNQLIQFAAEGSSFLFGSLTTDYFPHEAVIGFKVMPAIIFFSALSSILYYFGILQFLVKMFAWIMYRTMHLSGAETLSAAANVCLGYTEAPLMVRPYLEKMTRSEIVCMITVGMATMSGTILAIYMSMVGGGDPERTIEAGKHLISASIMAAPMGIVTAKLIYPETGEINRDLRVSRESIGVNVFDAVTNGTTQGIKLAINVTALLVVFVALIAMFNHISMQGLGSWTGLNDLIVEKTGGNFKGLTLQFIFGVMFSPIAWLMGVDWSDALLVGRLLGERLVITEFVAYDALTKMIAAGTLTDPKAITISTFALCGFAHFTSCGVIIGGLSVLAPGQRHNFARLAFRSLIAGSIATFVNATVAGAILEL